MTNETRWLDPDQQRNWRALLIGTQLLMDRLDSDLQRVYGLSMAEYEIMVRLSERPGRQMRMAQLADSLAHSRSRVTHTVKRMEFEGLVTRQDATDDGRGVFAVLTDKGHTLLEQAAFLHVSGVRAYLMDLVDPDDFAALGRAMNRVMDALVSRHPEMDIR
ncbi:MAG: MarR family transcriptional regulator [Nocardioides sp.]|jgi:DNA-binding MarR family transcriptional regulator